MIRLREERQKRGLSQGRLAALCGIHSQDISAVETGAKKAYPGWRKRIGQALGVRDADSLFEEVEVDVRDDDSGRPAAAG